MNKRWDVITIVRVFSCVGVFIVHLGQLLNLQGSIRVLTDFGKQGVMSFFIISGFLAFSNPVGKIGEYYIKRAIKILPVYYLVVCIYFVEHVVILKDVVPDEYGIGWYRYFLLANCWAPRTEWRYWYNIGLTWTMFVFILFYFLVPFLQKVIINFRIALIGEIILVAIQRLYGIYKIQWFWPCSYFLYIGLGILIFMAAKEKKERKLIFILGAGTILEILQSGSASFIYAQIFAIMILAAFTLELRQNLLRRVFMIVDEYSYSFYLIQGVFYELLSNCLINRTLSKAGILFVMLIIAGGTAIIVHKMFEIPIQKLCRSLVLCKDRT